MAWTIFRPQFSRNAMRTQSVHKFRADETAYPKYILISSLNLNRKTPTSTRGSDTPHSASVGVESPTEDSMFNFC